MARTLSQDDWLRALALFTTAQHHARQCDVFADQLAIVLGLGARNDLNRVSDLLWGQDNFVSPDELRRELAKDGFDFAEEPEAA